MSERLDHDGLHGIDDIDPKLLPWLPLTFRDWLVPPVILVLGGAAAILVSRLGHSMHPVAWSVAGAVTIVAGIVYALISHAAYIDLTEVEARRFRIRALTLFVVLAAVVLVAGLISGSGTLRFFGVSPLTPVLMFARPLAGELPTAQLRRNRAVLRATRILCLALVLASLGIIAVPSLPEPLSSAAPFTMLYGLVAAVWSHVQLRRDAHGHADADGH